VTTCPSEVCDSAVAQEMLCWPEAKTKEDAHMLGRLLVVTLCGLAAWKYRVPSVSM
jgi:hypothetical protein